VSGSSQDSSILDIFITPKMAYYEILLTILPEFGELKEYVEQFALTELPEQPVNKEKVDIECWATC
jgi:hypothetical protein